jgi:hypothetical protein
MRNFSFFENQRPQLESVVAQGNYIVVTAREQGHYRPIQHNYELHWVQVFFYVDGKLKRVRELTDGGSLIDAVRRARQ